MPKSMLVLLVVLTTVFAAGCGGEDPAATPVLLYPDLAAVPAATAFPMGWAGVGEPVHTVASIASFRIGTREVSWALWTNVTAWAVGHGYVFTAGAGQMGYGTGATPDHPVTRVPHYDALAWCNALSERDGLVPVYYTNAAQTAVYRDATDTLCPLVALNTAGAAACVKTGADGYRLPTEAEWEHAARRLAGGGYSDGDKPAGYTGTTLWDGATVLADWGPWAWWNGNSGSATHPVGTTATNALGLADMSGNVWEMCWDWYALYTTAAPYTNADPVGAPSGDLRVVRGSCWGDGVAAMRVSGRGIMNPSAQTATFGFRVARRAAL